MKSKRLISIIGLLCLLSFLFSFFPSNNSEYIQNNINNETYSLKTSAAPVLFINSPINYTLYGKNAPNFSITIDDLGNYTWYEFLETGNSSVPTELNGVPNENVTDTFNQSLWDNLANGTVTIRFYVNNSLGEIGYSDTIVRIDIIDPSINTISPTSGSFNSTPPEFTVEITEPNLDEMWYTLNTNTTKYVFLVNGTIDQNAWNFEADGSVTLNFFANDSVENEDSDSVQVTKDTYSPTITDSQAGDDTWRNAAGTTYDVDFSDPDPSSSLDYAQYKITTASGQGGTVLKDWTDIFTGLGTTTYTNNWTIDFAACQEGMNYVSVRVYDDAGNEATQNDVFHVYKDTPNPSIIDSQVGDDTWRNAAGTMYDVDFSDPDPSSSLDYAQYKITTASGQGGTVLKDWTDIFTGLGTNTYTNNWTIDFAACQEDMNYVSVRVYDDTGNMATQDDVFYVKKDNTNPTITDSQDGDDAWRTSAGTTYDVDFSDPNPSSSLDYAQYKITTSSGQGGTVLKDWTDIFSDHGSASYTSNWTIDFAACQEGINYVSVRVYDDAGNMATQDDVFYVKKDSINPTLVINSPTDDSEWNIAPDIQVTATDPNLESVWYSIGGIDEMLANGVSEPLNSSIWDSLSDEGPFTIYFYANDSAGNINNSYSYTLYKDVLAPRLIVNLPINNTYCDTPPLINITAFDMTTLNLFNYLVGVTQKPLINNTEQVLDIDIWNNLDQGEFVIYIYAWDALNNQNDTILLRLYKDTLAPEIIINSPEDSTHFNSQPRINITAIDPNLDTIWYRVGTTNITLTSDIEELLNDSTWNGLPEGPFNIEIFANDTFGHFNNSYVLTLYKDTITPSLIINLPINETIYNSRPSINVTVFDSYLDTLWYRVGNTNITLNNNTEELLNLTIWNNLPEEGAFFIYFYANDSAGNLNNTLVFTLYRDVSAPTIIINSPQPNDLFGENSPSVILNVQDANLDQIWYQLSNGTVTTNNYTWTGDINQTVWDQVGNGTVTIKFYANDTFNHLGFAEVTVRKLLDNPIIMIEDPHENDLFGIIAPNFTIYKSGTDLNTTWYTLNDGSTNFTFYGLNGTINQSAWESFGFGNITIRFYINDSLGNIGFDEITVRKDPDPPQLTITYIYPLQQDLPFSDTEPTFRVTVFDPNLHKLWYKVNTTIIELINNTDHTLDSGIWISLPQGYFIIEIFANDTLGYLNNSVILTYSKDTIAPMLTIHTPNDLGFYDTRPPINVTVFDQTFNSLTYSVIGYLPINNWITNNTWELLNQEIWDNLPQGEFLLTFTAYDYFGHVNDTETLRLYKDTLPPQIVINSPTDQTYWNVPPEIQVTATDPRFDSVWYIAGGTTIMLTNGISEPLDLSIWSSLTEGPFIVQIFANDSFGHLNDLNNLTLYKDLTPPLITINSPNNNTFYSNPPIMNVDALDASVDTVWYTIGGTKIIIGDGIPEFLDSGIWDNDLSEGEFQVFIFANDSAGNQNSSLILTLYKDTLPPLVIVNLPYNNTYWNIEPTINVVAYDPNNVTISYKLFNYSPVLLSNNTDQLFHTGIWNDMPQGMFILEILAEDIFGHMNDSIKLTLYRDISEPDINIIFPQPNDLFGVNPPIVNVDIQDNVMLDDKWYQLDSGIIITNNYTWTGTIEQTVWNQIGNGTVTIRFFANDTATNLGFEEVTIRKNIFAPIITINSPGSNELFGIDAPDFVIYTSGVAIQATWYTLDGGFTNFTIFGLSGTINQAAWSNFGDEMVTITFFINDTLGKTGFDEVVVRKDPTAPIIVINSPINQTACASAPFINITIIEPNLDSCWYRCAGTIINITGVLEQNLDSIIWNSLLQGSFIIELFANDTVGNLNTLYQVHMSKDTIGPNITIILPNENQKIDRNAPYFEISAIDVNDIDSRWYRIEGGEKFLFTGSIGRIDQTTWENIWDNLDQGDIITIRFYTNDTLGNENYKLVNVIKDETIDIIKFFTRPIGMIVPLIGVGVMLPTTVKLTSSRYYKSLNKSEKSKLKKVLTLSFFFLTLAILFYVI